jgi:hypothetical protein
MTDSGMGGIRRVAGLVLAALSVCVTGVPAQPPDPEVQVSPYLLRLSPAVVVDFGAGVIEAVGVSDLVEDPPAIRASRQARADALTRLSEALGDLPLHGAETLAQAAPESLDDLREAARGAEIVAEWYDDAGRVMAIAQMPLFEGPRSVLGVVTGLDQNLPFEEPAAPLPVLIVELSGDQPLDYGLLPRLRLPGREAPILTQAWRPLAREVPPVSYAADLADALGMLKQGQPSVVLAGGPDPGGGVDVLLANDSSARLQAAHLPPSYEAVDRVILTLRP